MTRETRRFARNDKGCAQQAHGVEDAEHGDTGIGENGHPHVGDAEGTEHEDRKLHGDGKHHVLPCVDNRLARELHRIGNACGIIVHEHNVGCLDCRV